MICELCVAMGGRFNSTRECCQLRLVATLPAPHRFAAFERVRATQGREAEENFKEKVRVEFARQRAYFRAIALAGVAAAKEAVGMNRKAAA